MCVAVLRRLLQLLLQQLSLLSLVVFLPLAVVAVGVPFHVHSAFVVFVHESFLHGHLALTYGYGSRTRSWKVTVGGLFLTKLLFDDD